MLTKSNLQKNCEEIFNYNIQFSSVEKLPVDSPKLTVDDDNSNNVSLFDQLQNNLLANKVSNKSKNKDKQAKNKVKSESKPSDKRSEKPKGTDVDKSKTDKNKHNLKSEKLKSSSTTIKKEKYNSNNIKESTHKNKSSTSMKKTDVEKSKGYEKLKTCSYVEKSKSHSSSNKSESKNKSISEDSKLSGSTKFSCEKISKSEKSKLSKSDKNSSKKSSGEPSKKLQDGQVSSSSIVKLQKSDGSKPIKSESSTHKLKTKDAIIDPEKRKVENDSDLEDNFVKQRVIKKHSKSPLKKHKREQDTSSLDEDDDVIYLSSGSEVDPNEECWKIYNEEYPDMNENSGSSKEELIAKESNPSQKLNILRKKRLAHAAAANIASVNKKQKTEMRIHKNPAQVMIDRYAKVKAQEQEQKAKVPPVAQQRNPEKKRIAAFSNPTLLAAIAEKQKEKSSSKFSALPSTVTKNLKNKERIAHVPDHVTRPRPVIPADYGSKVSTVVRQKFLNAFIDEYLKFSSSEDEAYNNALEEEKKAYLRSSSKAIYMNVASNTLARLRRKKDEENKLGDNVSSTTSSKSSATVSHASVLNGALAHRTSFSIERKKHAPMPDLIGNTLYEHLSEYILSEDQLKENGFPLAHPSEIGKAVIDDSYVHKNKYCNDPFKRTCCRCQKVYYVNVDGNYVRDEECDFHWGRLWKKRIAGAIESRYSCCQGDSESDGCCVSTGHVFDGSEAHILKGYVTTLPKTPPPDNYYGIYALDCEMCYTTAGLELIRVTVIGPDTKPVYDTFVKPHNKVLDYNTRFSGITEENLKNVRTSLRDVQAVLLCIFNNRTILVGHSLESDFKALKLIHSTVVDTSVVFPHKIGLPYKRALRTLMAEKLNKIIQNDTGGHDSNEDAVSCMDLMLWKIKEDIKANR